MGKWAGVFEGSWLVDFRAVGDSAKIKLNWVLTILNPFFLVKIQFNLILAESLTALVDFDQLESD